MTVPGPAHRPAAAADRHTLCPLTLGTRPIWMARDQYDGPCPCLLFAGHPPPCQCIHTRPQPAPETPA